jgi:hypothetical protein
MANVQGGQAPAKRHNMLKKFENSTMKITAEQSMSSQTPLGSIMEFARRSLQKIRKFDRKFGATTTGSFNTTTRPPTGP